MTNKENKEKVRLQLYKQKLAEKPFRSEKEHEDTQHYFNMIFLCIHLGNFATIALQNRGHLLKATAMDVVMNELQNVIVSFRKKLSFVGEEDLKKFDDYLIEMEDFIFSYVVMEEDERSKLKKFVDHLHRKTLKK